MRFYEQLDRFGSRTAMVCDDGTRYTFQALEQQAARFAELVYTPERRVAFLVSNNVEQTVWGYVGFMKAGVAPLMVGSKTTPELFRSLLDRYHPTWVWAEESFFCENPQYRHGDYVLSRLDYAPYPIHPELATMLTTSGSTGSPKCVRQSYSNIEFSNESGIEAFSLTENDSFITTLPLNYCYSLNLMQMHLLSGAKLIMNRAGVMSRDFWNLLREERATGFAGVTFTYEVLKKLRFPSMDTPSLRYVTQAGSKMEREAILDMAPKLNQKGIDFLVFYGQTEATCFISYVPPEWQLAKAGCIGISIPGGKLSMIDDNGAPMQAIGQRGELVFEAPNVAFGYAQDYSELNRGDDCNGRLATGDYVTVDEDGFYTIAGRKKRFLKIHGERVSLDEIESLLKKQGHEAACKGTDDHIQIYTTEADTGTVMADISALTKINRECLSVYRVSEIPRSEAGKIHYAALESSVI